MLLSHRNLISCTNSYHSCAKAVAPPRLCVQCAATIARRHTKLSIAHVFTPFHWSSSILYTVKSPYGVFYNVNLSLYYLFQLYYSISAFTTSNQNATFSSENLKRDLSISKLLHRKKKKKKKLISSFTHRIFLCIGEKKIEYRQ